MKSVAGDLSRTAIIFENSPKRIPSPSNIFQNTRHIDSLASCSRRMLSRAFKKPPFIEMREEIGRKFAQFGQL